MAENEQDERDEWWWERIRVQRAVDYHNKKYGTHIDMIDKAINVYPHLREREKQVNWDWVCRDTETNDEIAIEVKQLTDEKLEKSYDMIWGILREIRNDLSNKLPGTFALQTHIPPKNYYLPLKGQQNKQKFKDVLCEAIFQTAQTLNLEDERSLTPQLTRQLPFVLPDSFFFILKKVKDEGSVLQLGSAVGGFWSIELKEHELKNFERLVSHANNEQLKLAKQEFSVKETFLLIIEEGLRQAIPETVGMALEQINHNSHSYIDHIYYVSGEKVVEILLPTL